MLFQEGPIETTGYMIFGYSVIFGTIFIYLFSLFTRWRNLVKDQELLKELEDQQ
jgi:hypothetical protein